MVKAAGQLARSLPAVTAAAGQTRTLSHELYHTCQHQSVGIACCICPSSLDTPASQRTHVQVRKCVAHAGSAVWYTAPVSKDWGASVLDACDKTMAPVVAARLRTKTPSHASPNASLDASISTAGTGCVCTHTHRHTNTHNIHKHAQTYTHAHTHTHTCMYVCMYVFIHTCIHAHMHTHCIFCAWHLHCNQDLIQPVYHSFVAGHCGRWCGKERQRGHQAPSPRCFPCWGAGTGGRQGAFCARERVHAHGTVLSPTAPHVFT